MKNLKNYDFEDEDHIPRPKKQKQKFQMDVDVIPNIKKFIKNQKHLDTEISDIVDGNFWDLIDKK